MELAAEEFNELGGVLGRRIQLNFQDSNEEKSGAHVVSGFKHLRSKGIQLFIGPQGVPGIFGNYPDCHKG